MALVSGLANKYLLVRKSEGSNPSVITFCSSNSIVLYAVEIVQYKATVESAYY